MGAMKGVHRHMFKTQEHHHQERPGTTSSVKVEECRICHFTRITTVVEKEGTYGASARHRAAAARLRRV